jgi:hypothetical protein
VRSQRLEQTLEALLVDARAALADAEAERAAAETRVDGLRSEVVGLEAALVRQRMPADGSTAAQSPTSATPLVPSPAANFLNPNIDSPGAGVATLVMMLMALHQDWTTKKRASAVELVLRSASKPLHRAAITETLQRVGRPKDSLRDVSAALAYLHRSNRARPIGDGIWVHVDFAGQYINVRTDAPEGG